MNSPTENKHQPVFHVGLCVSQKRVFVTSVPHLRLSFGGVYGVYIPPENGQKSEKG